MGVGRGAVEPVKPEVATKHKIRAISQVATAEREPVPYSAGIGACRYSPNACLKIWMDEVRKIPAMIAATVRSGHAVAVPHTPNAATITTMLPMASLREHSQTDRTFASPSLYGNSSPTDVTRANWDRGQCDKELLDMSAQPERSCAEVDAIAKRHIAEIDRRIAHLSSLRAELQHTVEECGHGRICECRVIETLADNSHRHRRL